MESLPLSPILASFIRVKNETIFLTVEPISGLTFLNENVYLNLKRLGSLSVSLSLCRNDVNLQVSEASKLDNPLPNCMKQSDDLINEINKATKILINRKGYFPSSTLSLTLPEIIEKEKQPTPSKPYNAAEFFSGVNIKALSIPVIKRRKDADILSILPSSFNPSESIENYSFRNINPSLLNTSTSSSTSLNSSNAESSSSSSFSSTSITSSSSSPPSASLSPSSSSASASSSLFLTASSSSSTASSSTIDPSSSILTSSTKKLDKKEGENVDDKIEKNGN